MLVEYIRSSRSDWPWYAAGRPPPVLRYGVPIEDQLKALQTIRTLSCAGLSVSVYVDVA